MIIGIDIAKEKFDVTLRDEGMRLRHRTFTNSASGFAELSRWLVEQGAGQVHACLEATNVYWEALAAYLHGETHRVSVVGGLLGAARIHGYAKSQMRRNKTDKLDSEVIADFCATHQPASWTPPTAHQQTLRSLERHRDDLLKTRTQQTNRRSTCSEPLVQKSLDTLIHTLDTEIAQTEVEIDTVVQHQQALKTQLSLITSIVSIGKKTALKLMAELYDLAAYPSANAADADAGLSPARHDSGHSVHRRHRLCKVGKAAVRSALYLPALNAIRHNPIVKKLAQRLEAKGKPKMVIIGAAMRKLLHLVYGVLKHQTPFDPAWGHSAPKPS